MIADRTEPISSSSRQIIMKGDKMVVHKLRKRKRGKSAELSHSQSNAESGVTASDEDGHVSKRIKDVDYFIPFEHPERYSEHGLVTSLITHLIYLFIIIIIVIFLVLIPFGLFVDCASACPFKGPKIMTKIFGKRLGISFWTSDKTKRVQQLLAVRGWAQ